MTEPVIVDKSAELATEAMRGKRVSRIEPVADCYLVVAEDGTTVAFGTTEGPPLLSTLSRLEAQERFHS